MDNETAKKQIDPIFFSASTKKFVLMYIATSGIYSLYWFYKNWVFIKSRTNQNIMPLMRSIFNIFFVYSFFSYIKEFAAKKRVNIRLPVGFFTAVYIFFEIISIFYDTSFFPNGLITVLFSDFVSLLILLQINIAAERINKAEISDYKPNDMLSENNWIIMILGVMLQSSFLALMLS
jgi:hypothetical protein